MKISVIFWKKIQGTLRSEKGNCARQLYIGICHAQARAREKFRHATSVCLPIPKSSRTPPNTTGKFNNDSGGSHGIWSPETIHPNAGQDPRPTRRGSDKVKGRNPHPWEGPIEGTLNLTYVLVKVAVSKVSGGQVHGVMVCSLLRSNLKVAF